MKNFSAYLIEATIHDERELLNTKWGHPREAEKWLKNNGFKKIGGGVFAGAWLKPNSKRVIKVSRRPDPCWLKYAQWVVTKTNNKYLPDIPWIGTFTINKGEYKGEKFFIVPIEKLSSWKDSHLKEIDDPVVLATLFTRGDLWAEERKKFFRKMKTLIPNLPDTITDSKKFLENFVKKNSNHPFVRTHDSILKLKGGNCWDDLHSGNIMWRDSTKSVVITDPLAGEH